MHTLIGLFKVPRADNIIRCESPFVWKFMRLISIFTLLHFGKENCQRTANWQQVSLSLNL